MNADWEAEETTDMLEVAPLVQGAAESPGVMVLSGPDAGLVFELSDTLILGRGSDAQIRLNDMGLSRHHARFLRTAHGGVRLEDLGSAKGTLVNRQPITEVELKPGDTIHVGSLTMLVFTDLEASGEGFRENLLESVERDPTTGVLNRPAFHERLRREVAFSLRTQAPLTLALLHIHPLETIADSSDAALGQAGRALLHSLSDEHMVGRLDPAHLAVLIRGVSDAFLDPFCVLMQRTICKLRAPEDAEQPTLSAAIGAARLVPTIADDRVFAKLAQLAFHAALQGRGRRIVRL